MNERTLKRLKPFIYGKLLGDAFLSKPKKDSHNSRLEIVHTSFQNEYVKHCYLRLHNFSNKYFTKTSKLTHKGRTKIHKSVGFKTKALPEFSIMRKQWYKDIKVLPKDLEEYFTAETLAYWYMDDGYIHCKKTNTAIVFCCESFLEEDVDRLIVILNKKFNIYSYKDTRGKGFRIRIGKQKDVKIFKKLVRPFILPCFDYKLRDNPYHKN